jgi:hypothetical protein
LAAIFAKLEFARFYYLMHIAGKNPGYATLKTGRPACVHRHGMGPASGAAKHAAHSAAAKKPPLRKIMSELNRWLANSPTHINKYFSGLKEASIR